MRAFVQASVKSRGYYWVKAEDNAEVEDVYPDHGFRDCASLVDAASPSLVIAAVPTEENREGYKLALLILGLREQAENVYVNIPPTSLFLIFEPEEEEKVRALAVALLSPSAGEVNKHYSHNAQVTKQINTCVSKSFRLVPRNGREMREDYFTVIPEFFPTIDRIIKTKDNLVLKKERAKFVTDYGFVAKTSIHNQQALAAWLCENSLRLAGLPERVQPLIVVTANKLPDKIVADGAWRVMSNLADGETWKALHTSRAESTTGASATGWVKKAKPDYTPSPPPRVSQEVKRELEEVEPADNYSKSEEDSAFQPEPAEQEIPTLGEWGEQLLTHLSLLPSVISNSVRSKPKKP